MADQPKLSYDVTKLPQPLTRDDQYAIAILVETRATRIAINEQVRAINDLAEAINALLAQLAPKTKTK